MKVTGVHPPFLVGEKTYYRAIERRDLEGPYFQWLNDPEVTQYMMTGLFPNTMERMEHFLKEVGNFQQNVFLAVIDKATDKHIGNVKIGSIDWIHHRAEYGIMIGDKNFWGKGYCTEATRLMVQYAFEKLNLHRLELVVVADHAPSVASYERVGFKIEGRAREQFHSNGKYLDRLYMAILRRECSESH